MKQVYDCLPKNRKKQGFTLTEILVAVAILVILFSLATVSFVSLQKNLRQKELDAKAEVIYAAAQNRMAELRAAGYGDSFALDADRGVVQLKITPCDIQEDEEEKPTFYYVKALDKTEEGHAAKLLLTETAVDRELWSSQWVIEYNADTGLVYAVFYSEEKTGSSYLTDSFYGSEDYRDNMRIRSNRLSDGARIGYYGGDLTRINGTYLLHPYIEIENTEKLTARFSCVSPDVGNDYHPRLTFQVTIADRNDPSKKYVTTLTANQDKTDPTLYKAEMVLDNLENDAEKFYIQFQNYGLVPGNNIAVTLTVTADDPKVDKANYTAYTNSLFAYEKGGSETVARIAYRRHLQNLDTGISHVDPKVTSAILLNDLSYKNPSGGYYGFTPITNAYLHSFSGKDSSTDNGVFSIKDLNIGTTEYGGLFAKYNGTVSDLVMSNTRVASGTGYAGALIGLVNGNTELKNVRVYLSDLSVTKYKSAPEVPGFIKGGYAGGMVGLVESNTELKVLSSAAATTVAANNAAGGVAGLVRGVLNVEEAYTDCYLNANRTGGLVGAGPVAQIIARNFYTTGYQVAASQAAGIMPGTLKSGSFRNGYTAVSYTVPAGGAIYTTAGNGSVDKVYSTTKNALGETITTVLYDIPGTGSVTSKDLSSAEFKNKLSGAFRFNVGGDTVPYNLLDQGLTDYPYPMLKNLIHYGDWEEDAEGWNFVYFEEYADGTYGVYGSGLRLSTDKAIVGDGYGLLLAEVREYQIRYTDKKGTEKTLTYTKTDHASNLKTITSESGITYYLPPMTTWTDSSYGKLVQDSIGRAENSFYCKAELRYWPANNYGLDPSFRTYWFNPYFAKTVIRSEQMPANPGTISIRDARHLYSLSDYYSAEDNTVNAGRHDLPGLLTNTADKTYTFLQERTVDFDADYKWDTYYDGKKQPTAFAPIGSDTYQFNSSFNGQSLQVRNADILSKSLYTGFFGYIGAEGDVENLLLVGSTQNDTYGYIEYEPTGARDANGTTISGSQAILRQGAVAGYNEGVIYNCAAAGYGFQVTGYSRSTMYVGGLVGVNAGIVQASSADTPTVTLRFNSSTGYVGGLVGYNTPTGAVAQSYAFGTVTVVESKRATANVAGLVANNRGSVTDCYCGVAFTVSGDTAVYGFAPQGGTVNRGYYLDGGTYSYAQKLYSFNISNSGHKDAEGEAITAENLQKTAITDFGAVDRAHTLQHPQTKTDTFSYSSAVRDANGSPVHLGNWPNHEKNLGSVGVFYWELEENGSNPGYHLSYVGYDGASVLRDNTLCTSHDDGGVITAYGYGYFLKGDGIENPDISSVQLSFDSTYWNIPESAENQTAADSLHAQMPQYVFKAYQTGSSVDNKMYLQSGSTNGIWTLTYNSTEYEFSLTPFFANAMSLNKVGDRTIAHSEPGTSDTANVRYEIRSIAQLQNINWNYGTKTNTYALSRTVKSGDPNWNRFPYLSAFAYTDTSVTAKELYWVQSHDLDSYLEKGAVYTAQGGGLFTPIGSMYDMKDGETGAAFSSAESSPYAAVFTSSYNGQAYTIKNVEIQSTAQMIGLFGLTSGAKLRNIIMYSTRGNTVTNLPTGENWYCVGGLVGLAGSRDDDSSVFENCTVSGYKIIDKRSRDYKYGERTYANYASNPYGPGWGGGCVGGMVGATNMDIRNCTAVTDITLDIGYSIGYCNLRVGGLVGVCRGSVDACYVGGSIVSPEKPSSVRHDLDWAQHTSIWVGGIVGGIVMRDAGTLMNLLGDVTDQLTVSNSYSFVDVPEWSGLSWVMGTYSIASNGEMQRNFLLIQNPTIEIVNCYAYEETARNSEDYKLYVYLRNNRKNITWSRWNMNAWGGKNSTQEEERAIWYKNDRSPYMNFGELSNGTLLNLLNRYYAKGQERFHTVTTYENGFAINGKYSFPGNERLLNGLDYPFPTVLSQYNSFGAKVFVHYGRWPMLGLYWEENEGTIDLFKDRPAAQTAETAQSEETDGEQQTQEAQTDAENAEAAEQAAESGNASNVFKLRLVNVTGANHSAQDIKFTYYAEGGTQKLQEANAAAVVDSRTDYDSTFTTNVTVKAQMPGTVVIRASYTTGGTTYTADLTVTVTMDLKLIIEQTALEVYEGDTVTTGVHFTDAENNEIEPPVGQLTWRDQIQGTGTAKWSVAEDPENAGKFLLTVEGVHAGTLSGPQSVVRVEYKPDANSESSVTATAQFTLTVKPSVLLGLGDGTDFSQVTVPHTPVEGQVEGKEPAEDQQPVKLTDVPLYLYSTVDYVNLRNFRLDSVYLTIDGQRSQLHVWSPQQMEEEAQIAVQSEEEPEAADTPEVEEPDTQEVDEAQPVALDALPEGTYYADGDYVLTVGEIQNTGENAQYCPLTLTKKDGTAPEQQWTLELTLSRLNNDGTASAGSYYLVYKRPNMVRFFAPDADVSTAAPLKEVRMAQDAAFSEDELNALNAELRKLVPEENKPDAGHYWLWTVTGNITGNLNVLSTQPAIPYSIAYDGNFEGWQEIGEIPATYLTYGDAVELAQSVWDRTGMHLANWYWKGETEDKTAAVDDSGVLLLGGEAFVPTEPNQTLTLFARWEPNTYGLSFDGNGTTETPPTCDRTFTYGQQSDYTMPEGLTREGYTFQGWRVGESLLLAPGKPWPADFAAENGTTVIVRADWKAVTFRVTLHGDGQAQDAEAAYDGSLPEYPFALAEGKTFGGWALTENGEKIESANALLNASENDGGRIDLYAILENVQSEEILEEDDASVLLPPDSGEKSTPTETEPTPTETEPTPTETSAPTEAPIPTEETLPTEESMPVETAAPETEPETGTEGAADAGPAESAEPAPETENAS